MKGTNSITCVNYDGSWSPEDAAFLEGAEESSTGRLAGMMFQDLHGTDSRL